MLSRSRATIRRNLQRKGMQMHSCTAALKHSRCSGGALVAVLGVFDELLEERGGQRLGGAPGARPVQQPVVLHPHRRVAALLHVLLPAPAGQAVAGLKLGTASAWPGVGVTQVQHGQIYAMSAGCNRASCDNCPCNHTSSTAAHGQWCLCPLNICSMPCRDIYAEVESGKCYALAALLSNIVFIRVRGERTRPARL